MLLHVKTECNNEYAEVPAYGIIDLTPELANRILALRQIAIDHRLSEVRQWHCIDWSNESRIRGEELVVTDGYFQIRGYEKSKEI